MPAGDGDDDIRKYMPDLKTILRTADPAVAAEKRRAALDAPDVVEAIAKMREGEDEDVTPAMGVVPPTTSTGPWTGSAVGEIDKAMLPSSFAPRASAEVKRARVAKKRKAFPRWVSVVAAIVAAAAPVMVVLFFVNWVPRGGAGVVPSASAAPYRMRAPQVATQAPSVERAAHAPEEDAVAPQVPGWRGSRPNLEEDPSDAADPPLAKTVKLVAPSPRPTAASSAPPSATSVASSKKLIEERPVF